MLVIWKCTWEVASRRVRALCDNLIEVPCHSVPTTLSPYSRWAAQKPCCPLCRPEGVQQSTQPGQKLTSLDTIPSLPPSPRGFRFSGRIHWLPLAPVRLMPGLGERRFPKSADTPILHLRKLVGRIAGPIPS
jgi:hypothetical protein